MKVFDLWGRYIGASTGWKKAAKVNCALLTLTSIIVSILSIIVAARASHILRVIYFYEAPCDNLTIPVLNLLASSNFFMQVLNAPSRDELDVAHRRGKWLEIGVSSMRNLFIVSKFKTWCWLGLSVTSVPIHLLFNSAIFSTEYRESDFTITIVTEDFLNGGSYYLPGASLLSADGFKSDDGLALESSGTRLLDGFGQLFSMSEYTTKGSGVERNISDAALHGKELKRLEFSDCQREFGLYGATCSGLTRYRDVILVAQNSAGWKRNEIWHLMDNQTRFWDHYVPPDKPNHLFYYTTCTMNGEFGGFGGSCKSSCYSALGGIDSDTTSEWPSGYPFFSDAALAYVNGTDADRFGYLYSYHQNNFTSGLQPGTFNLSIHYCLARTIESTCHIGVSPLLLIIVLVCIVCKTSIAALVTVILGRRNQRPLVTLGDCLASFIENPDVKISNFSTIALANIREGYILSGRARWQFHTKRRASMIPHRSWFISYHLFVLTIGAFNLYIRSQIHSSGYFLPDSRNPLLGINAPTFLGCVLLANTPQLVLSLWYFSFNNLFTRLQLVTEWEQYGKDFLPLRVTDPEGKQKSTYRLQLPYKYGLPLITLSALLHWLLSNTIYTIVSIGDPSLPDDAIATLGYSPVSLLLVATLAAILITIPLSFSLKRISPHIVPGGNNSLLLAMACRVSPLSLDRRLTAPAPDAGSGHSFLPHPFPNHDTERNGEADSLLQLTKLWFPLESHDGEEYSSIRNGELYAEVQAEEPHSSDVGGGELQGNTAHGYPVGDTNDEPEDPADELQRIARSEIRWGVLKMPPEWYDEHDYEPLGFATRGEDVTTPAEGKWYL
ncbi:hypothetical protein F4680DRAFT_458100 [Xylaria scruposa]|nr:hypothetical protein F4680DRAFT_458100 [Xylaria scruposa]